MNFVYVPVVFIEQVTVQGGYLKHPVAVTSLRRDRDRFIILEHCDLVCKVVIGRGRGRTSLKEARTLCKLCGIPQRRTLESRLASALA